MKENARENAEICDIKAFLQRLQGGSGVTELSNLHRNLWDLLVLPQIISNTISENRYFICFEPTDKRPAEDEKLVRTSKEHIKAKSYIYVDFDVRQFTQGLDKIILTDEQLFEALEKIKTWLAKHDLLKTRNAIVFTGNGFQLYRIGQPVTIDADTYSEAVRHLLDEIKSIFKKSPALRPDYSCTNISRLGRLPGSTNYNRQKKFWLEPRQVEIVEYKDEDSPLMEQLVEIWQKAIAEKKKYIHDCKEKLHKLSKNKTISDGENNSVYEKINSDISIAELVCQHTSWTIADDGINFRSGDDGWNKGAFLVPEENIVIRYGTPHISNTYWAYSPFAFVMVHFCSGDPYQTFERFKGHYPAIREFEIKLTSECPEVKTGIKMLDYYMKKYWKIVDTESEAYKQYYEHVVRILKYCNFLLFPVEKVIAASDTSQNIDDYIYKVHLLVHDSYYQGGIIEKEIEFDHKWLLDSPDKLKSFLEIQVPLIHIRMTKKPDKDKLCNLMRISLLAWYEKLFGLETNHKVARIGFNINDSQKFIFSNWLLDLDSTEFKVTKYFLKQDEGMKLSYPHQDIEGLWLDESLRDLLSLKKYISSEDVISAIILWYMVGWIFRTEYKKRWNEFPFLGIEWYTGCWKTSELNLLSRTCWYDRASIEWVCDTDFAFEVGMSTLGGRFYFHDEIQKASDKLLKYIQAAYNSWVNHKWWKNWDWQMIQSYRKDCSLICAGEILPYKDEAFINRFVVIKPTEPFLVRKMVKAPDELLKYQQLWLGSPLVNDYLSTDQIKLMAVKYYRPRFLNILKNKSKIDFGLYHEKARTLIHEVAGSNRETRILNNLSLPITGYLVLLGDTCDEDEVKNIISQYLENMKQYRSDNVVSSQIVSHIISNIGNFCSRIPKVKWLQQNNPMMYCKYNPRWEQGIIIQLTNLAKYVKDKMAITLDPKHIIQQLEALFWIERANNKNFMKALKSNIKMDWTFIPLNQITGSVSLQKLWDNTICYLDEQVDDLQHIRDGEDRQLNWNQPIQTAMSKEKIDKLIDEIRTTYNNATHFDGSLFEEEQTTDPF